MLVVIKSDKLQIHRFKSLHNAEQFKSEFIEDFIMSKQGSSAVHMKLYKKPKRRQEWLYLPHGYVLTYSRDSSKITCYYNTSSAGTFYNDYSVKKVFSVFIIRIEKKVKIPAIEFVDSRFFDNHNKLQEELKSKFSLDEKSATP